MVTPASATGVDVHRLSAAVVPAAVHPLSAPRATPPAPVSLVAISAPHPSSLFYSPGTVPFASLSESLPSSSCVLKSEGHVAGVKRRRFSESGLGDGMVPFHFVPFLHVSSPCHFLCDESIDPERHVFLYPIDLVAGHPFVGRIYPKMRRQSVYRNVR